MARIFVSYSRRNKEFCKQLTDELQKREFDFWVDWEGIPPTVDWMKEIEKGIEEADSFLAIVTPDWMSSRVCIDELNIAVKNGKRLIPVVPCDIAWNDVHPALAHLNFIFFTEAFDFNEQVNKLFTALDTDYDWLKTHRRLQVKALEWERAEKENGFLLRGRDLEDAEQQISINATKNPNPTDLQRDYILKSRQETERQNRIRTNSLRAAGVVMLGIIAALVYPYVAEWVAQGQARGELVEIVAGSFYMGSTDPAMVEFGERGEWLTNLPTFYMEKYEVTNKQYALCVTYGVCTPPGNPTYFRDPNNKEYPVLHVNIYQANAYCRWIGRRLPSELEWIRAARGLDSRRLWPWDDNSPDGQLTNMPFDNTFETDGAQPVTSFSSNKSPEGVQNLVGNALEWTSAYYLESYYYGSDPYDMNNYWDGQDETYDGTRSFIRLGGGWQRRIYHLAEIAVFPGENTDANTGIRCASD